MTYINVIWSNNDRETVDEFTTRKEARRAIKEYRLAYGNCYKRLYLSSRCCKSWKDGK